MDAARTQIGRVRFKQPAAPAGLPLSGRPMALNNGPGASWSAYDGGAPFGREVALWQPWLRSPDAEINADRDRMVARARDLFRNDGWASGAINRIADSAIGAQFFPIARPLFRVLQRTLGKAYDETWAAEFASAVVGEWRMWADDPAHNCDAGRRLNAAQIFRQAFVSKVLEGDGLALLPWQPDARDSGVARYATTVQLIDADRLCNNGFAVDSLICRAGVQIDGLGAPVGYHFRRGHLGDAYLGGASQLIWDYFPRYMPGGRPFVVHDYDATRPDQHRGTGVLSAVLNRFRMLNKYDATSIEAAMVRTVFGAFITSSMGEESVAAALQGDDPAAQITNMAMVANGMDELRNGLNTKPITMNGVAVPVLGPNEKLQVINGAGHADDFAAFESAIIRSISSATGQAAEEISNNFAGLNYSSFRGALLQSWRTLIRRRRDFQSGFAQPIYTALLEEMVDGTIASVMPRGFKSEDFISHRAAFAHAKWIGPGRGWVDPVKERQGELLGLDAGFGTLEDTCADISGTWWEDTLDQRQREEAGMKKRDLTKPDWAGGNQLPAAQQDVKPQPE